MASDTYSNTLGFLAMGTGNDNNTWGSNANSSVFQIFEDAIANFLTSAVTGGTLDLSGTPPPSGPSQVRYSALIFTGTLTANQIVKVPNLTKFWWVNNQTSGAFTLTIETPTITTSAVIPQNSGWQLVLCDGNQNITASPFNSKQIQMPDGSAAAPSYSDVNETGSGLYRHGSADWRFAIKGTDVLQVTGTSFNLLNNLSSSIIPTGTEIAYAGLTIPSGFLLEYGQTVSRTTYANLLNALRLTFTGTFSNGSATISGVSNFMGIGLEGATLECATAGITGLTVSSVGASTITMSGNASASSGGTVTIYAYPFGNGDGVTTFTLPDRRGRALAGRDNMGGTNAGRLSSYINSTELCGLGGSAAVTFGSANLPTSMNLTIDTSSFGNGVVIPAGQGSHNHTIDSASGYFVVTGTGVTNVSIPGESGGRVAPATYSSTDADTLPQMVGYLTSSATITGGGGTALDVVQPTAITNWLIKT